MTEMPPPRPFWARLALVVAAGLTVLFLVRAVFFATIWYESDPASHPVEPWMTPRYIARSYNLPPAQVAEALGILRGESPRKPLAEIAEEQGVAVETLISAVETVLREARSE
jgi:hypothetical protein